MKTASLSSIEGSFGLTEELFIAVMPAGVKSARTVKAPFDYEAFVYVFFCRNTGKVLYIGYHKGVPDGTYWYSAKTYKTEMDKIIKNDPNSDILYGVVGYGSKQEMLDLESSLMRKHNPIYNDSYGSGKGAFDTALVDQVVEKIFKGMWKTETFSVSFLYNLNKFQVRLQQTIPEKLEKLKEVFRDGKLDRSKLEITLIEISKGVYKLIDGNHTVQALHAEFPNLDDIKVNVIPLHVAKDLTESQRKLLALRLNPQIIVQKDPNSEEDNVETIYAICKKEGIANPLQSQELKDQLKKSNHNNSQIARILNKVHKRLKADVATAERGPIIDYKNAHKRELREKEHELNDEKSTCCTFSTGKVNEGNICRHIRKYCVNDAGKLKKGGKTHLNVLLYHPSWEVFDEWKDRNKKEVEKNLALICRGNSVTYSIVYMPHELDQKA